MPVPDAQMLCDAMAKIQRYLNDSRATNHPHLPSISPHTTSAYKNAARKAPRPTKLPATAWTLLAAPGELALAPALVLLPDFDAPEPLAPEPEAAAPLADVLVMI
jgi:hypothetical protein